MNAIAKVAPALASNPLMPVDMHSAMGLANMMATAKLVPAHLHDKPGDCLMVIELAMRLGMSPFAVAQSTSVIQGRLMLEGKLVAAALNACGILAGRMTYNYDGEGAGRAVTASATVRGEREPRVFRCTLAEAKTTNGMWQRQPDQQLAYFATRAWARRHAPEVMLGVYSPEEFDAPDTFRGHTIDAVPAETTPPRTSGHPETRTNGDTDGGRLERASAPAEKPRTQRDFLADLAGTLAMCRTIGEVDEIASSGEVRRAITLFRNGNLAELNNLLADAMHRCIRAQEEADAAGARGEAVAEDGWPGPARVEATGARP